MAQSVYLEGRRTSQSGLSRWAMPIQAVSGPDVFRLTLADRFQDLGRFEARVVVPGPVRVVPEIARGLRDYGLTGLHHLAEVPPALVRTLSSMSCWIFDSTTVR